MHILGIVGSMRKNRNTDILVNYVVDHMRSLAPGVEADIIHIAGKDIHPCRVVCSGYCSSHSYQCSLKDDVPAILDAMIEADALIIGAPLYFRAPPAKFHALVERLISISFFRETQTGGSDISPLAGKPCGLIGVAEYSNPHQVLEYLHDFCMVLKMRPLVLDKFPYLGVAGQGDVNVDDVFHPFERAEELAKALVK